jgi:hypothetical protein
VVRQHFFTRSLPLSQKSGRRKDHHHRPSAVTAPAKQHLTTSQRHFKQKSGNHHKSLRQQRILSQKPHHSLLNELSFRLHSILHIVILQFFELATPRAICLQELWGGTRAPKSSVPNRMCKSFVNLKLICNPISMPQGVFQPSRLVLRRRRRAYVAKTRYRVT